MSYLAYTLIGAVALFSHLTAAAAYVDIIDDSEPDTACRQRRDLSYRYGKFISTPLVAAIRRFR
jgi:hypothetical protein